MSAKLDRRPKARPVLAAALFLLLGAGGGYAFAFVSTEEAQHYMWPVGAIIAAAVIFILMRFRLGGAPAIAKDKAESLAQPAAQSAPESAMSEAPEPVVRARSDEPIIHLDGPEIDLATLESLRKLGGEDFVKEVVTQFISEGVVTLFKVAQSIGSLDVSEYAAQVHALRSSAANVGARRLYRLCLDWRELSESQIVESGSARFLQFQREFSAAERMLTERHESAGRDVAMIGRTG
ncbi:MAG: hypothetical protein Q8M31_06905 [Beijerinckiaceae bacterium]|nr:hypothetical protein [Beijerinckiaceae bacterium]